MAQDETHLYEIDLTQGDLLIQLLSDDRDFITRQMDRWFALLIDERYQPIAIAPGNVTIPPVEKPAPEPSPPSVAASPPQPERSIPPQPEPVAPAPQRFAEPSPIPSSRERELDLIDQIKQLQSQIQILSEQALAPDPEPGPLPPIEPVQTAFSPPTQQVPPITSDIDSFASPAHTDFGETFPSEKKSEAPIISFEQAVQNPPQPVQTMPFQSVEQAPEPPIVNAFPQPLDVFQQPVQNQPGPPFAPSEPFSPATKAAPPDTSDDFDLLLDTIRTDLEEEPSAPVTAPPDNFSPFNQAPNPLQPQQLPPAPMPPGFPHASAVPPNPYHQPAPEPQSYISSRSEPILMLDNLDADLQNILHTPQPRVATMAPEPQQKQVNQIHFDFSQQEQPAAASTSTIQQLNFDTLQTITETESTFESAFPSFSATPEEPSTKIEPYQSLEEELQIETLLELWELAPKAATGTDFLILAAYFLSKYKECEKYALKDLNAQLSRSGLTPVNHSILEEAISRNFLAMIPDLTGTANAAEYTLTQTGFTAAKSLINF